MLKAKRKGNQHVLRAILRSPHRRRAAREALRADYYAYSTDVPRSSRLRLWASMAADAGLPPWPLTQEVVETLMGALKLAGYRSAGASPRPACTTGA